MAFASQSDRDRTAHGLQAGVSRKLSEWLEIRAGFGIDGRTYLEGRDDFGLARDNLSAYPLVAAAYASDEVNIAAAYSPVWRIFEDPTFDDVLAHVFSLQATWRPAPSVQLLAGASSGLQETDFLISRTIVARVFSAGAVFTAEDGSNLQLEGIYTREEHKGLKRIDDKIELRLAGRARVSGPLFLTFELSYLGFKSSFGDVGTEEFAGGLGLAYAFPG